MTRKELEQELAVLLQDDAETVRVWQTLEFDRQTSSENAPDEKPRLVLFGAGGLGRKTLNGLRSLGIEPLAFADNNAALHGQTVDGLQVLAPRDALQRFGNDVVYVVTIWGGRSPDRMGDRIAFLRNLGCRNVISFYPLYCKYAQTFLPHYACDLPHRVREDAAAVKSASVLWADGASRREFIEQLKWRGAMDFSGFPAPVQHEIYFPDDLVALRPDEVFVDCGAFDGDTLRSFIAVSGGRFQRAFGFEPDPDNFVALKAWLLQQPPEISERIHIDSVATSSRNETLRFLAGDGEASSLGNAGSLEVEAVALDSYFENQSISYLKMDIEGAELETICGAAEVIRRDRPVLAVCVYHQQNHLWAIPNELNAICSGYQFYLRPHLLEGWDTVLYAIPCERVI